MTLVPKQQQFNQSSLNSSEKSAGSKFYGKQTESNSIRPSSTPHKVYGRQTGPVQSVLKLFRTFYTLQSLRQIDRSSTVSPPSTPQKSLHASKSMVDRQVQYCQSSLNSLEKSTCFKVYGRQTGPVQLVLAFCYFVLKNTVTF